MFFPKFLALCLLFCFIYRFVSVSFCCFFCLFLLSLFLSASLSISIAFFLDYLSLFNSWLPKDSSIKNLCTPYLVCRCMYEVWRLEMGWVLDLSLRFRKICISIKLPFIAFLFSMFNVQQVLYIIAIQILAVNLELWIRVDIARIRFPKNRETIPT